MRCASQPQMPLPSVRRKAEESTMRVTPVIWNFCARVEFQADLGKHPIGNIQIEIKPFDFACK